MRLCAWSAPDCCLSCHPKRLHPARRPPWTPHRQVHLKRLHAGLQDGGGFQDHVKDFKWSIMVVNEKQPNAFVLPGGKIVVFTGGRMRGAHRLQGPAPRR